MTNGNILVLDVGGSFLKYGVADQRGALLPGSVGEAPARADESPARRAAKGRISSCGLSGRGKLPASRWSASTRNLDAKNCSRVNSIRNTSKTVLLYSMNGERGFRIVFCL